MLQWSASYDQFCLMAVGTKMMRWLQLLPYRQIVLSIAEEARRDGVSEMLAAVYPGTCRCLTLLVEVCWSLVDSVEMDFSSCPIALQSSCRCCLMLHVEVRWSLVVSVQMDHEALHKAEPPSSQEIPPWP